MTKINHYVIHEATIEDAELRRGLHTPRVALRAAAQQKNITYPIDSWNRAILNLDYKISFIIYCFKSESYASGDIAIKMK